MPNIHIHDWQLLRKQWACSECPARRGITIDDTRAVVQDFVDINKKR